MDRSLVEKEKRLHGSAALPIALYDNYRFFPQFSKRLLFLHWHDEAEFVLIRKGAVRLQVDGSEYNLRKGDAAQVPSGAIHTAVSANGRDFWYDAIVFSVNFLTSGVSDITQLQYIGRIKLRQLQLPILISTRQAWGRGVVRELMDLIEAARRKAPGYELALKGSLFKAFSILVSKGSVTPDAAHRKYRDLHRLKFVIQYIHENYAQKLTLHDLAALSNLSKYYFCRFFKECIGRSPVEYLHSCRLLKSEQLLKDTNLKVVDIAYEVGFTDLSHFIRLFHKATGVSPSLFRNRNQTAI